jgi:hypothetical protein
MPSGSGGVPTVLIVIPTATGLSLHLSFHHHYRYNYHDTHRSHPQPPAFQNRILKTLLAAVGNVSPDACAGGGADGGMGLCNQMTVRHCVFVWVLSYAHSVAAKLSVTT